MFNSNGRLLAGSALALCAVLFGAQSCTSKTESLARSTEDEGPEPVSVTVFTEEVELFMEYPRLVPGLEARFLAHVTVLATGEPVRSGELALELTRDGAKTTFEAPEPTRDGLFIPVGALQSPGTYAATILVRSDQALATISLDPIVVHADLAAARAAAEADSEDEPAGAVPFLLEQQWKIGMLQEQVTRRTLVHRLQVPGTVRALHHADAIISAPFAGRLVMPGPEAHPEIGDHVEKGQVVAFIEPPLTTSDLAQLSSDKTSLETLELELLVREFDLEAKALALEQTLLQSRARVAFAEQALARIEGLRTKDLGTAAELEAAHRDLEIAKHENDGALLVKQSYAQAAERLAGLRARAATSDRSASSAPTPLRFPLIAPISGEIVQAGHVEGESIGPHGTIYRVVDPSHVLVVAQVSEFDLAALPESPGAIVKLSGDSSRTIDLLGELGGTFIHKSPVVNPDTRTVDIRYDVPNTGGIFRLGMFADMFLETNRELDAVAIPESAVVMDDGKPVAFVLHSGETFLKRDVDLGIRDEGWVEVRSGISAGERVVTKGAYFVKLASASPAAFGEGHAH